MPGVTNRFEDFFGTHIAQTEDVSFRGMHSNLHLSGLVKANNPSINANQGL